MTATSDVKPFTGTGTIINPATGAPAGQVRWTDPADVARIASGLREAQREWEARGPAGRAKVLARYAVWLGKHRAEIEELLIKETGKSATDAAQEVPLILMITSYYIRTMEKALAPDKRPAALPFLSIKKIEVHYRPRPVVGIIAPWNYPVANALMDAIGAKVAERAARRLTPVSLELGGKDPMIVLEDADVELAAHAAVWGAMFNAGQTCVSVERVYVLEPVYDQFVAAVVRDVENLEMGAGDGYDVGSLIDESQVAVT